MSLLTTASLWTNDNSEEPKKRVSTMRKTMKKMTPHMNSLGEPDDYVSEEKNYKDLQVSSIEETNAENETKAMRVTELLNKMTVENDGNKLANYVPLANPILNSKKDVYDDDYSKYSSVDAPTNPLQVPLPKLKMDENSKFSANDKDLGNYSNYRMSYDPSKIIAGKSPYYSHMGIGANTTNGLDDKLMQKINYMVHLLEQQQNEKTSNITEEFILYTFLGVFIIFLVDSFARAGKYTR